MQLHRREREEDTALYPTHDLRNSLPQDGFIGGLSSLSEKKRCESVGLKTGYYLFVCPQL